MEGLGASETASGVSPEAASDVAPEPTFHDVMELSISELVGLLTASRFFDGYHSAFKTQFIDAQLTGQTFLVECWDPLFNKDFLGFPTGPSSHLSRVVKQIYRKNGMS
jgi:hypothetical protein